MADSQGHTEYCIRCGKHDSVYIYGTLCSGCETEIAAIAAAKK